MRLCTAEFLTASDPETGPARDPLGNAVTVDAVALVGTAWLGPCALEAAELDGRGAVRARRRLLTAAPEAGIAAARRVRVDGVVYDVTARSATPRWRVLTLERWERET